jgi:hypothetical protein
MDHHHDHKNLTTDPIPNKFNKVHVSVYFSEICFNIILASEATFLQLSTQNLHNKYSEVSF